jgi:hypothetical protein
MTSREQFMAAISKASTPAAAAGLCNALHLANVKELFEQLDELLDDDTYDSPTRHPDFKRLKAEYTNA